MRSIVFTASTVRRVARTSWPVSAAVSAWRIVSTSGSSADDDDVGVLSERVAEPSLEGRSVLPHLALVDDRHPVLVQELDRLLDGEDVARHHVVDPVDERRQRRGGARAVRTAHQHEPRFWSLHSITSSGRPRSSGEGMPGGTSRRTAPTESRCTNAEHAEAALAGDGVRRGELPVLEEPLALRLRQHAEHQAPHIGAVQGGHALHPPQLALEAHHRRAADGEVEVRPVEAHDPVEQVIELHPLRSRVGGRLGAGAAALGPVAVLGLARPVHLADEAHELVPHRHHGVDGAAEVGLQRGEHLLVARVVHGDDHTVVAALEGDRQVAAGEVFGDEPHTSGRIDRSARSTNTKPSSLATAAVRSCSLTSSSVTSRLLRSTPSASSRARSSSSTSRDSTRRATRNSPRRRDEMCMVTSIVAGIAR